MTRPALALLVAFALAACSTDESQVREAAARDFGCPEPSVEVLRTSVPSATPPGSNDHLFEATGCGQRRTYRLRDGVVSTAVGDWYAPR